MLVASRYCPHMAAQPGATRTGRRASRPRPALFKGGEARLEHVETHAWGDTVVVAMIERQHSQFGGLPDQDCSLRVTHVYRRDGSDWQLVHRHADPLVRQIELEELASLIR